MPDPIDRAIDFLFASEFAVLDTHPRRDAYISMLVLGIAIGAAIGVVLTLVATWKQ